MSKPELVIQEKPCRKAISKKTRFEVFKRDQFVCQYCGSAPPSVILELDHIHPVSKGGSDHIDNLLTACVDCNRGKSDGLISVTALSVSEKREILVEKEAQLKAYRRLLNQIRKREEEDIDLIQSAFKVHFTDRIFSDQFRDEVRIVFLPYIEISKLRDFMFYAAGKFSDPDRAIKYFCGMCWNVKKGRDGPRS